MIILTNGERTRVNKRSPTGGDVGAASASESEAEDGHQAEVKFEKGTLTRQIVSGGGVIFNQKRFDNLDQKLTFCVANTFCRTAKFINALGKAELVEGLGCYWLHVSAVHVLYAGPRISL